MSTHLARVRLVTLALLGLALIYSCSTDHRGGASRIFGVSAFRFTAANGLDLSADPIHIVIDPSDPTTPTDPNHGNERYGTTVLTVTARDTAGKAQRLLPVTLSTSAGALTSGGAQLKTDTTGIVRDTLRAYQSNPDTIHVSVTDGTRITTIDVTKTVVGLPVANAGPDQTVPCTGNSSAQVTLDGSASTDPASEITTYDWFEHYGTPEQVLLDRGKTVEVVLPLGEHVITLLVVDALGDSSTDQVVVKVEETTPPVVDLNVSPSTLWPPNHKMVHVTATLGVSGCSASNSTITLESVTSNEPDNGQGDGDTSGDIQGADIGTADHDFDLRAERAGGGHGRVYTIVYRVMDAAGNATSAKAYVMVPHDHGK
jgi:hypothetical protein